MEPAIDIDLEFLLDGFMTELMNEKTDSKLPERTTLYCSGCGRSGLALISAEAVTDHQHFLQGLAVLKQRRFIHRQKCYDGHQVRFLEWFNN